MSFGIKEVSFLCDLLNIRFGITGSILRNKSNQYFIRLNYSDIYSQDRENQQVTDKKSY